jgi:hypothetical protein
MIKKITSLLFVFLISYAVIAQTSENTKAKLSPQTKKYLLEVEKQQGKGILSSEFIYKKISGKYYLSALLKVNNNVDEKKFNDLNILVGTKAGNIWTAQIPLDKLKDFVKIEGLDYIELDQPVFLNLDSARHDAHVDSVHQGIGLPQAYTGKNVVVGIIDAGFDFTHPEFMDTSGTHYRIKKAWEQKSSGTPPSGYSYGNELTDSTALWDEGTDVSLFSHGTHVAGISAGSGIGGSTDNHRFRGVAFESDVVLVGIKPDQDQWTTTGVSNVIDGLAYIFDYAASVGKPAVANLSWGCSMGPHDGTSLFSQAVDNLTGPGKIFVCAAGNNGADNIHLHKVFAEKDSLLRTFVGFSTNLGSRKAWVDLWGQAGKSMCVSITLYNGMTAGNTTGFICLDDSIHSLYLKGSAGDTCYITLTTSTSDFNGNPRVFFDFNSKSANKILITVKSFSGIVNMWTGYVKDYSGYYGNFNNGALSWATIGNKDMTTSDFSSTHSAISVAAYASKTMYTNYDGGPVSYNGYVNEGKIAPFSSHGPAADSTTKPDIAAPGLILASGINSFDTTYNIGGANRVDVVSLYNSPVNGRNYSYAMMMGTSMASPMTSGIVALMLQANPALTPQLAKEIIWQTAITDAYTGVIPQQGSYIWGFGKINAYAAVNKTWQTVNVSNIANDALNYMIYPNPNSGSFSLEYNSEGEENLKIEITDMLGKIIFTQTWNVKSGANSRMLDITGVENGIYFTKITSAKGTSVYKMICNGK